MVVKLGLHRGRLSPRFESRAVLDGSQTGGIIRRADVAFESRAVLDGSQT